ncbi:uncharacterized protein [Diadema setosum]|uniref:uncharacterized protein n=1 Tax=Diadema setosum TaxID=31175 RepID=UPI003B3A5904
MDTFIPSGFSFSMDLPDIPFTPISPASASSFLFPMASASSSSVTQSRRCSTPYSRDLRRRRSQMDQENTESKLPVMDPLTAATTFNVSRAVNATAAIPSIGEENEAKETSEVEKMEIQSQKDNEVATEVATEKREADAVPATTAIPSVSDQMLTVADKEPKPTPASQDASQSKTEAPHAEQEKTPPAADQEPEKNVLYFKNLVFTETDRLLGRCKVWEDLMSSEDLSDEVCGEIRSASGKAKLLIDQRFKQFRGLINDCEFGLGEKATHCSDLAGFWEMVYFQVEDVDALFKELETLKVNGWKREEKIETKPKVIKKKKPIAKKSGAASSAAGRNAARERLMAAKAAMKAKATRKAEAEKVVFEGGFFKVESPARKAVRDHCGAGSPFKTSKQVTPSSRVATPRVHTPRLLATPRNSPAAAGATNTTTTTPKVSHNTPTVAQLFSPMVEPRRSLRTKLCGEISKLVLSDKKATPTRRTPSVVNKENEVDLSLYLQPSMSVVDLNQQAEDLMVTEPADQLEQLGARSPAKNLRSRRSVAKAADPISPAVGTRSQALRNSTNTLGTNLCSPSRRKTRKSSLGFGLSAAASLFTPSTTPVPCEVVDDLISFD